MILAYLKHSYSPQEREALDGYYTDFRFVPSLTDLYLAGPKDMIISDTIEGLEIARSIPNVGCIIIWPYRGLPDIALFDKLHYFIIFSEAPVRPPEHLKLSISHLANVLRSLAN